MKTTPNLVPIPDFADIMTIEEWLNGVESGCFIDYDGHGYWATSTHQSKKSAVEELYESSMVLPSHITKLKIKPPSWATHVAWYNK